MTDDVFDGQTDPSESSSGESEDEAPELGLVRWYLSQRGLEFKNGRLVWRQGHSGTGGRINATILYRGLLLDPVVREQGCTRSDLKLAFAQLADQSREKAWTDVTAGVTKPLTPAEAARAEEGWHEVSMAFDIDADTSIKVLQHFVWMVKRKLRESEVEHHLMPMIVSGVQGVGKTTFKRRFLAPLGWLTRVVSLAEVLDTRNTSMLRMNAVLDIDEFEVLSAKNEAYFKMLMTTGGLAARRMHSNEFDDVKQRVTFIASSNFRLAQLVPDSTGRRRFAELPFRNANANRGGDAAIWGTINSIPYELLWRSVDPEGPAPILPMLGRLADQEQSQSPTALLKQWILAKNWTNEGLERRGAGTSALHDRFQRETGLVRSCKWFSIEMDRLAETEPHWPFYPKTRRSEGSYFPLRIHAP